MKWKHNKARPEEKCSCCGKKKIVGDSSLFHFVIIPNKIALNVGDKILTICENQFSCFVISSHIEANLNAYKYLRIYNTYTKYINIVPITIRISLYNFILYRLLLFLNLILVNSPKLSSQISFEIGHQSQLNNSTFITQSAILFDKWPIKISEYKLKSKRMIMSFSTMIISVIKPYRTFVNL